uniref:serine/threonine-protein kinase n=1 Tax=Gordonia sp. B7-2 TaxID=3420932 RepID=UPI003D8EDBA9
MGASGTRLAAGDVIAGYTVIRTLGRGGMGTVYLVQHPRLPRNQALKVLASTLGGDPSFRERFRREADLASRLDHPNIVNVQDAGVEDDVMWIAMQYVDGTDTAAMLRDSDGPLQADAVVGIIAQVASALDYAHAQGLLHRDVKPANVLVTAGHGGTWRALIGDFGVARLMTDSTDLTGTGNMIGTLNYAAPEMFGGAPLTPAVDVYALGCTLYELLAGQPVFTRPDQLGLIGAHAHAPVPRLSEVRPDLPLALDDVIFRALAKRPEDRFRTCTDLAAAASAALHEKPAPTTTMGRTVVSPPAYRPTEMRPTTAVGRPNFSGPAPAYPPPVNRPPTGPPHGGPVSTHPRRTGLIAAAVVGVVVLVAAIAIAAVVLTGGSDDTPSAAVQTTPSTVGLSVTETSPPTTTSTAAEASLTGTWRGAVSGDQTGFDVIATITSNQPVAATVEYPQIGCAGTWTEKSRQGTTVILTENITRGTCVTSEITITPISDDSLSYYSSYFSQSQNRTFVINATLRRV